MLAQLCPRYKPPPTQKASIHVSVRHDNVDLGRWCGSSPVKPSTGVPFLWAPQNQTDQPKPGPSQHDVFTMSFLPPGPGKKVAYDFSLALSYKSSCAREGIRLDHNGAEKEGQKRRHPWEG